MEGIKVEERRIPVFKPAGEIPIRIYTPDPETPEETFPILVDLHGMLTPTNLKLIYSHKKLSFSSRKRVLCRRPRHRRAEMPRRVPNAPYRRRERRLQACSGVSVANGDR